MLRGGIRLQVGRGAFQPAQGLLHPALAHQHLLQLFRGLRVTQVVEDLCSELQSIFSLKDSEQYDCDRYDLLSLDCFSIPSLRFHLEGVTLTRLEKTRELADWPPAWKYLHVCCADRGPNCGMCAKCVRTQTTLDALGALRHFGEAFDVERYYARRKKNMTWLAIQHFNPGEDELAEEVYQALRKQIPLSVKISACFRAWRRRLRGRS